GDLTDNDNDGSPDDCTIDDCLGMVEDTDDDNDGIEDIADTYPNDFDNDGIDDNDDANPTIAIGDLADNDNDGSPDDCTDVECIGMVEDNDDEKEGIQDYNDANPLIPIGDLTDNDNDGSPDDCSDVDCLGMAEDTDDDNDGIEDDNDANPNDFDNDGIDDNDDANPTIAITGLTDNDNDGSPDDCTIDDCLGMVEDTDDDNDGIEDDNDANPDISIGELTDNDNDGAPDDCTAVDCLGMVEDTDDDNDGIEDDDDAYPNINIGELADNDNDGLPDDCTVLDCLGMVEDTDDDNDGIEDLVDIYPNDFDNDAIDDNDDVNPTIQIGDLADNDNDGSPDDCTNVDCLTMAEDTDDDNDGVEDDNDSEPTNPFKCRNLDGDNFDDCASGTDNPLADGDYDADGLADDLDPDADNDGVSNANEIIAGSNPLDKNDTIDLIAPVITVPADIVVDARDSLGAVKIQAEIVLFLSLATAADNVDGVLNNINNDAADLFALGDHIITFTSQDDSGNTGQAQATITVADLSKPDLFLRGDSSITIELGALYTDEGVIALDNVDGDISQTVIIDNNVDINSIGLYSVIYNVSDAAGNVAQSVTRNISVQDSFAPIITVPAGIIVGADNSDGTTSDNILISTFLTNATVMDADQISLFEHNAPLIFPIGPTIVTFSATDITGNVGQLQSTIMVKDLTPPVIILEGSSLITLALGDTYNELGATANDNVDGDLSIFVQRSGTYDTSSIGIYMLSYDVSDMKGNPAETQIRQLSVQDVEAPIITTPLSIIIEAQSASGVDSSNQAVIDFLKSASATDAVDGEITPDNDAPVTISIGKTTVMFTASDSAGNTANASAFITVEDQTPPIIILNGETDVFIGLNETYVETGATATDIVDGVLDTDTDIIVSGEVDITQIGLYTITYRVSDFAENSATIYRTVTVQDQQAPIITAPADTVLATPDANGLPINDPQIVDLLNAASVMDDWDVDLVITHNAPDVLTIGVTTIKFTAVDAQGNIGLAQTVITIEDQQAPELVLLGDSEVSLEVIGSSEGSDEDGTQNNDLDNPQNTYEDPGATAMDNVDGDITGLFQIVNNINLEVIGEYSVQYSVSDNAGNSAVVTRVVYVIEADDNANPASETPSKSGGIINGFILLIMMAGLLLARLRYRVKVV
ncbi:MAG: DUF5011 domain-containing protein, partial [Saccharospirillaceae bacterium]|nr:DUF5011 domain-containing protein [Saccharospirillaceae bacterium]